MAEPLRATFYALKKHNSRGGVLLGATLTTGVIFAVLLGAFIAAAYPMFAPLFTADSAQNTTAIGAVFSVVGWALLFALIVYVLFAAYEAACLRWMIRGEAPGWFGLTLGADTWRVYAGYWIWFLINMALSIVVSIIVTPIMLFAVIPNMEGSAEAQFGSVLFLQLVTNLIYYGVMVFVGVRFAPAAATSIARSKFAFFDAWAVTKGRFWPLLGSLFVLMLGYLVVFAVLLGFVFGAVLNWSFPAPAASPEEINAMFLSMFTPQNLVIVGGLYLLLFVTGILYVVFSFGVNARAVIAAVDEGKIEGRTPNVAQVFA